MDRLLIYDQNGKIIMDVSGFSSDTHLPKEQRGPTSVGVIYLVEEEVKALGNKEIVGVNVASQELVTVTPFENSDALRIKELEDALLLAEGGLL